MTFVANLDSVSEMDRLCCMVCFCCSHITMFGDEKCKIDKILMFAAPYACIATWTIFPRFYLFRLLPNPMVQSAHSQIILLFLFSHCCGIPKP